MNLENMPSCPICGSYEVKPTTKPDEENQCEYVCQDCGDYFVADAVPEESEEVDTELEAKVRE